MRVSLSLSAALVLLFSAAGCAANAGDDERAVTQAEAEVVETDASEVTGNRTLVAYAVETADGYCSTGGSCEGFWLRKLNSYYSSWRYVAAMEISSLFVTDGELATFVTAAHEGRAILFGAVVRSGIVIGSRNAIVIGSRNGIVIGSRDIVIGSREEVVLAASAYVSNVAPGSWLGSFWNVTAGYGCWQAPCSSFAASRVNASYPTVARLTELSSSSADTTKAVNDTVVWEDVLVAGERSNASLGVDAFFTQVRGTCGANPFTQAYAR